MTTEEFNAFRPDLLLRIGCTPLLSWNVFESTDYDDFVAFTEKNIDEELRGQKIDTDKIVLCPYGKKDALKKGVTISANNGKYFSFSEIVWKAKVIQETENNEKSNGIGIYRLGFEKRMPSYYVGQYTRLVELLAYQTHPFWSESTSQ